MYFLSFRRFETYCMYSFVVKVLAWRVRQPIVSIFYGELFFVNKTRLLIVKTIINQCYIAFLFINSTEGSTYFILYWCQLTWTNTVGQLEFLIIVISLCTTRMTFYLQIIKKTPFKNFPIWNDGISTYIYNRAIPL